MLSLGGRSGTEAPVSVPDGLALRSHRFRGRSPRARDLEAATAFGPDLIHAFNSRLPTLAAARAFHGATGAPVFVHFEDSEWDLLGLPYGGTWQPQPLRRALATVRPDAWLRSTPATLRWTARHARAIDALTPALAGEVERRLGRRCAHVPPPSPRHRADPEPFELPGALDGRHPIVYAGSIGEEGLPDLRLALGAVAQLQREGRRVALVHAGRVILRRPLHRLVDGHGLEHASVQSLGYLPPGRHRHLLDRAAVLVQPGLDSATNRLRLPSKLQSYLASGSPTVTYGAGFGELLEDRVEVLKTHTSQASELATRIGEVLDDPELRATLAEGGPRAAARLFDPERNVGRLVEHYRAHL